MPTYVEGDMTTCELFPDDFGQFRRFSSSVTELVSDGHTDERTDPHTEIRGRILKRILKETAFLFISIPCHSSTSNSSPYPSPPPDRKEMLASGRVLRCFDVKSSGRSVRRFQLRVSRFRRQLGGNLTPTPLRPLHIHTEKDERRRR